MVQKRHINHLRDKGRLIDNQNREYPVSYDITVSMEMLTPRPGDEPIDALQSIQLRITGLPEAALWSFQQQEQTLVLIDGRKLKVEADGLEGWFHYKGGFF